MNAAIPPLTRPTTESEHSIANAIHMPSGGLRRGRGTLAEGMVSTQYLRGGGMFWLVGPNIWAGGEN